MPKRWTQTAMSLTETVIATFLLVAGFLMIGALYFSSLRQQSKVDAAILASIIAEKALEDVRAWAQTPANFDALETIYSPYNGTDQGFTIEVEARAAVPISSPCSQLESAFPAGQQRRMTASFKPLQVRVRQSGQVLTLDTLLGDPPRQPRDPLPVQVSSAAPVPALPAVLNRDAGIDFAASLLDSSGAPIPDVFFTWTLAPITGNGMFTVSPRDGRTQTFTHRMMLPDGAFAYAPGVPNATGPDDPSMARISANCTYRGREYSGDSPQIPLQP